MPAIHFLMSGIVQGIGFRYSTCNKALQLGLNGWVRNLHDGRVEAFAEGDDRALAQFADWLQHGPSSARVDAVIALPCAPKNLDDFIELATAQYSEQVLPSTPDK